MILWFYKFLILKLQILRRTHVTLMHYTVTGTRIVPAVLQINTLRFLAQLPLTRRLHRAVFFKQIKRAPHPVGSKTAPAPAQPAKQRKSEPQGPGQHQEPVNHQWDREDSGAGQLRRAAILVPVEIVGARIIPRDLHLRQSQKSLLDGVK